MDDPLVTELRGILHDFYLDYNVPGDGDKGLVFRLNEQFHRPRQKDDVRVRAKPQSKAPGDIPALSLAEEIGRSVRYWTKKTHPAGVTLPLGDCVRLLPDLALGYSLAEEIRFEMRSLRGRALIVLGYKEPPRPLRGAICNGCGGTTVVYDPESLTGDRWCSSSGPEGCHDDLNYPDCRALCGSCGVLRDPACEECAGQLGLLLCRHAEGSQRHAIHWDNQDLVKLRPAS